MIKMMEKTDFAEVLRQPDYVYQLYKALHPDDADVVAEDCELVLLGSNSHNDLYIQVKGRLLILLVESQQLAPQQLAMRLLLHQGEAYWRYIVQQKLDLNEEAMLSIPKPELYIVYTGKSGEVQDNVLEFDLGCVKMQATVLCDDGSGDILAQHTRFCKIANRQHVLCDDPSQAVDWLRECCREEGVLIDYLT
ncbi:MAG: hypothetical protein NC081_05350 [Roseburia sp.]|nr:hypothetical protein [Lachnospiraceae bacterium]MCM1568858.1 hypothetical protein [Roseburia sp.]